MLELGVFVTLTTIFGATPTMAEGVANNSRRTTTAPNEVRAVLAFDADCTYQVPQSGSTPVVPTGCQTSPYIAGADEIAVVNMDGFFAPNKFGAAFNTFDPLINAFSVCHGTVMIVRMAP